MSKEHKEYGIRTILLVAGFSATLFVIFIVIFLFISGTPAFTEIGVDQFFTGTYWNPDYGYFYMVPIIVSTLLVTIGAMAIAIPVGIGCAIFISQLAPSKVKRYLKTSIELLAGVPSIVYGFFGLLILTQWVRISFDLLSGSCWLTGSIILAIMALPTIVTVAEDSISAVPKSYADASLAIGATKWQTIRNVTLPAAKSGIITAIILGIGRSIGETMAVMMVTGNQAILPQPITNIFSPIKPITATLALELGEAAYNSSTYYALYALAIFLFMIVFVINSLAIFLVKRRPKDFKPKLTDATSKAAHRKQQMKFISYIALIGLLSVLISFYFTDPLIPWLAFLELFLILTLIRGNRFGFYVAAETLILWLIWILYGVPIPPRSWILVILGFTGISIGLYYLCTRLINFKLLYLLSATIVFWLFWTWVGVWNSLIIITIALGIYFVYKRLLTQRIIQGIAYSFLTSSMGVVIFMLGTVITFIVWNGAGALSWEFITQSPSDMGRAGGIYPAIIGTLLLAGGAILIAGILGVLAGIYLGEYAKEGKITKAIRAGMDNLNGTPSIVFGMFGLAFFVFFLDWGRALLAGQITLAMMILPTITRTTEEAIRAVPDPFREGSLALGATKWQTTTGVVLPTAAPGIITGLILGFGRAAGETAPILFVATVFDTRFITLNPFLPVSSLPTHLYTLATAVPNSQLMGYGTALILLLLILIFYGLAMFIRSRYQRFKTW
ncbi:MAG: phosphate ABC transporter permease PstA [Promethearchaeota archaeon]|nr:MAG: phosphate ABC transporter permease PstA [Candidatus Lokiarchaeota archaeon]